jgi:hypothetical protein
VSVGLHCPPFPPLPLRNPFFCNLFFSVCCLDSSSHPRTTYRSPSLDARRKLDSIGSHTLNPSSFLPVRALQLVICYRSRKDLWSRPPLQQPTLLSSHMRKVRRKHRASDILLSPRRSPSPIRLASLLLHPRSLKSLQNPLHLSMSHRYLLLISLFPTHPHLAPRALTYSRTPRLVTQQHTTRALEM